jgi:hypothetical protein
MIPTDKLIVDLHRQVIAHAGRTNRKAAIFPVWRLYFQNQNS